MKCSSAVHLLCGLAVLAIGLESAAAEQCPALPGEAGWLEQQMQTREKAVFAERALAIELLKRFLAEHSEATQRAEALFRLAELQWEHAEAGFLKQMKNYDQELETFRNGTSKNRPDEPRIDLAVSLKIYEEILEKHPGFERADTVLYLYGFGLNELGDEQTALSIYRTLLKRYPHSAFVPDAHLAIGEYHFAKGRFTAARSSYEQVIKHPDSPLYDLALYKTAWCYFKEGRAKKAADRFRHVLRRSREQKDKKSGKVEASAAQLEKEALEDLALTFSESGGAQEAYRFMKQVGGEEYSIRVLRSLGDVFFRQARYTKAIKSFRILVERFPLAASSPENHAKIADAYQREGKLEFAARERQDLAERYGPGSSWAKSNAARQEVVDSATRMAEESLRFVATYRHKQAQEKKSPAAYQASSLAYRLYLKQFDKSPAAPGVHFGLGEVLYQLKNYQKAADHYSTAAQRLLDPKKRIEAAYAAVLSFDHLRQKDLQKGEPPSGEQKLIPGETGFVRAVDEFGRLAPDNQKLPQLRFEVGKTLYFRGQYPRAAQHFLALVQNHPDTQFSMAAADLALDCYSRSKDWEALEKRARRFKSQGLFAGKDLGSKLPSFISAAIFQAGAAAAKQKKHLKAARKYKQLVEEFPKDELAPKALFLAAVSLEEAGEKKQAVQTYQRIIKAYPDRAAEATFVIAGIYERQYDYQKAATHYDNFAHRFKSDPRAPQALIQAALLHRARRAFAKEARTLQDFTRTYSNHKRAPEALFLAGLALERAGSHKQAERTFSSYLKRHAAKQGRVRECTLHLGQAMLKLGRRKSANNLFERCGEYRPRKAPKGFELASAAHCRFMLGEMVFDEYKKIKLRPPKRRLVRLLKQKATLLKKAESLFTGVVAAGHMEWASAALFRIGDMYAQFATAILQAPLPKGLSQRELEVYRQELQSLAFPIEDKALTAFTISYQMARRHGYFSIWSQKTIGMLRKLDPANHPKEEEERPHTEWADSHTTFPLILKPLPLPRARATKGGKP